MNKKDNSEIVIREYARSEFISGVDINIVLDKVNDMFDKSYSLKILQRWRVVDEWDAQAIKAKNQSSEDKKIAKKLPALEVIRNDSLADVIWASDILKEQIQEDVGMGKRAKTSDINMFILAKEKIIKLTNEVVVGSENKGIQIANIVQNFYAHESQKEPVEVEVLNDNVN